MGLRPVALGIVQAAAKVANDPALIVTDLAPGLIMHLSATLAGGMTVKLIFLSSY